MNKRGFTLIELLVVMGIIAILSVVSITAYIGVTKKAARSEAYSNLESLRLLMEQRNADAGNYGAGVTAIGTVAVTGFLPGFRPSAGGNYNYSIISTTDGLGLSVPPPAPTGAVPAAVALPAPIPATTPCFVAVAQGIAGSRICPGASGDANCDVFAIDCMNNRNF